MIIKPLRSTIAALASTTPFVTGLLKRVSKEIIETGGLNFPARPCIYLWQVPLGKLRINYPETEDKFKLADSLFCRALPIDKDHRANFLGVEAPPDFTAGFLTGVAQCIS